MSDKKIIGAKVQVDADEAQRSIFKLKGDVDDLRKAFSKTTAGTEEQLQAFKKLKKAEEDLTGAQDKLNKSQQDTPSSFAKIKDSLGSLPGAAGAAGSSITGLSGKFKALLANPVVLVISAIVAVLAALGKAFASTRKGAELIGQGMAFLTGAIDKVVQIVGDFIGGIKSAGDLLSKVGNFLLHPIDSFKKLGKEVAEAANETARLKKEQQGLERDMINNMASNRELIKQEEALKNVRDNEFNSTKDRIAANEQAASLEKQRLKELEGLQQRQVDLIQARINLKGGEAKATNEEIKELREAQAELADIQEESIGRENEFITNRVSLQKEAEAKIKEARDKAAEQEKQRLQNLLEYTNKLAKLQQDNQLALIRDGYLKEVTQLRNRISDEKKVNAQLYKERKISLEQLNALNEELDIQRDNELKQIKEKYRKEEAAKEEAHQKNIEDLKTKIRLSKITDNRELEKVQLQLSYEEQLKETIALYTDNQERFQEAKALIDEQYRIEQQKVEKKNADEDAKKKLEDEQARLGGIASDPEASFKARRAAIDAEIALNQELFDKKQITEAQYNEKKKEFHKAREALGNEELESAFANANKIGGLLENISELVGKQTVVGKAFSVANATIQAIESATSSYKAMASIPVVGPALGFAAAAAALGAGIANVKKIIAVKVPGQGDSSAAVAPTSISAAAPIAPTPTQTSTSLDQDTINNIGSATAGGVNSIRAYVVEQDSAEAAARAARLKGAAVLGG